MKNGKMKFWLPALSAVFALGCWLVPARAEQAFAADSEYTAEYREEGVKIPLLHTEKGQSYRVEVFDAADTAYASPLELKDAFTFVPDKIGQYLLRYLISDNGIESYKYGSLTVEDTTSPVIEFSVKESYKTGETLALNPRITDNTASMATVAYTLIVNGKAADSAIKNNAVVFTEEGEYKLQISVKDGGGNTAKQLYSFTVEKGGDSASDGENTPEKNGCGSTAFAGTSAAVAALSAALLAKKRAGGKRR